MIMTLVSRIFPGIVNGLYAYGVERAALERALNGLALTGIIVLGAGVTLFFVRKRIASWRRRVSGTRLFMATLASMTLLSFPDPVFPLKPNLDVSWQWALNHFAFSGAWGRDFVFTYGPLGWLLCPSGNGATVLVAIAANLAFSALWVWSVRKIYLSSDENRAVAWGLVLTMLFPQVSMEWRWGLLALVLTQTSWFAAGIVTAMLAMTKFSSLIMVVGTQTFFMAANRFRKCGRYFLGFAVAIVLLSAVLFNSPQDAFNWANGSIQITLGYNQHMVTEKNWIQLAMPIVAILALAHRPRHLLAIFPLAPMLYCTLKYNWVRQGIEPLLYTLMAAAAVLMGRFTAERRRLVITACAFLTVGYALTLPRFFAGNTYIAFPFGVNPLGVIRTVFLPQTEARAKEQAKVALASAALPSGFRRLIGDKTVQLLPHEFAPAMADPTLRIVPFATLQMYSAYTVYLDELAANSYEKASAPDFIALDLAQPSIDGKNAFLDCPRAWAAIRSRYVLCAEDGTRLLLRRRPIPRTVICDKRISTPEEPTVERLVGILFRNTIHTTDLVDSNGKVKTYRVNPSVLSDPVDHDLPLEVSAVAAYFRD